MMDWLVKNHEWVFDGFGVAVVIYLLDLWRRRRTSKPSDVLTPAINISNVLTQTVDSPQKHTFEDASYVAPDPQRKQSTHILFIDDDTRFKVVKILKNAGWPFVNIVKDVPSLTFPLLVEADILFVDIQGVGKALGFSDEGLGLALALKQKFPQKKVIIYSSQRDGERFHEALRIADYALEKNADPYEFLRLVEQFAEN